MIFIRRHCVSLLLMLVLAGGLAASSAATTSHLRLALDEPLAQGWAPPAVPAGELALLPALQATPAVTVSLPLVMFTRPASATLRFAVIGDYGMAGSAEADVAALVRSWNPYLLITTGDNNYNSGAQETIDANIGQYYAGFIGGYVGSYGPGAARNRFFPSLGNHDWATPGAAPYLGYFSLPGNERYYDFVRGPVHFFALDSDPHEPDGVDAGSAQALWLKARLASSTAVWQVVYFHHPPFSSGSHGNTPAMQWPFAEWGADVVLSGHDHSYERIMRAGLPYIVNGLGGRSLYAFGAPVEGSVVRYSADYGAMLVDASDLRMTLSFVNRSHMVVDTLTLRAE